MSNHIEVAKSACRMDCLIGNGYQICAFSDLPVPYQLAISHYLAIDCGSWEIFYDDDQVLLHDYIRKYGDQIFGVIKLDAQCMAQSVMADPELVASFSSWEQYTNSYCAAGDVPEYSNQNRWPVILSQDNYETLLDGWHRFHSYMRSGCLDIPAVFFPSERHLRIATSPLEIETQSDAVMG